MAEEIQAPPEEAAEGSQPSPGQMSYEIEHDIRLVREVATLSFPWRLQHTILPGTLGVHCFKGRLRDADGRPNLYPPGTSIQYQLFAAPPWSDALQHVIIVSRGAQRVKISIRCPLPGLADEPLTLALVIRFEVTDPIKLIERTPGWEQPNALGQLNAEVARDICDAVEGVVRPLLSTAASNPEWLTPSGTERLKDLIVAGTNLADRGLSLLSDQAPLTSLEYPRSLLDALDSLYNAYILWQRELSAADETRREALADELGGEDVETKESLRRGAAPPLDYLVRRRPDLLEAVLAGAGDPARRRTELLRKLLRKEPSSGFYGGLVAALLKELKQAPGGTRGSWERRV